MLTRPYSAPLWLAIYLALQLAAPFLRVPTRSPLAVGILDLLSTGLFIFLALCICASMTHRVQRLPQAGALLAAGAIGWGVVLLLGPMPPNPPNLRAAGGGAALALHLAEELFRILAAVGLGTAVASLIRERNILLPAAVFAAFADYFVVFIMGPVKHALQDPVKGAQTIQSFSAKVPSFHHGAEVLATVGMADFLFLALFFACVHRFGLDLKRSFLAFLILLVPALFFALKIGPIPALAPMALAFVAANFRCFSLSRSEKQAMGAAAVIVLVVAGAFVILGSR